MPKRTLKGQTVLVTAGPTREYLDPIRYLTNPSTGKMGYSLAEAAVKKGAKVILISGPTILKPPRKCVLVEVVSAREMNDAVLEHYEKSDIVIKCAAVADYHPQRLSPVKMKKEKKVLNLRLVPNPDILATLGKRKKHQFLVGFAAETHNSVSFARGKLNRKNCDLMILNQVARHGVGFGSDYNEVSIVPPKGRVYHVERMSKVELSSKIIDYIIEYRRLIKNRSGRKC